RFSRDWSSDVCSSDLRLKERDTLQERQLALANKRRALKGEPPFKNFKELEKFEEERAAESPTKQREADFLARESGEILVDLIELNQQLVAEQRTSAAASR